MSLKERLQEETKNAMRSKDKLRLDALRLINAGIKQIEVDQRVTLSDADIVNLLNKMRKQRQESAKQYLDAHRPELAEKENFEIDLINSFLPQPLSEAELAALIAKAIEETGAAGMQDMGKVMAILKVTTEGRADMALVGQLIKQKLG